jgi:hypothetical protein
MFPIKDIQPPAAPSQSDMDKNRSKEAQERLDSIKKLQTENSETERLAQEAARALEEEKRKTALANLQQAALAELESIRQTRLAGWIQNGGDAEGFDKNWPAMRDEILVEKATMAEKQARGNQEVFTRSNF